MSTHPAATVSAVIVADDGIGHLEGHIIRVGPAGPLHGNGHMGQRQGIVTVSDLAASEAARSERGHSVLCVCPRDAAEVLLGEVHQLPVLHPCRDRTVLARQGPRHRVGGITYKRRVPPSLLDSRTG